MPTLRVLHVDDDEVNRLVMDHLLSALGHSPCGAATGAEALAALGDERFDLVLSDIHMPELDGIALLEALRQANSNVPIVAVTADVMTRVQAEYRTLGFSAALGKPVLLEDLRRVLALAAAPRDARTFFAVGIAKG